MTINAGPGSARHAPRPHSAAAGTGTRQCTCCLRREPMTQFYAGNTKCSYCIPCWRAYQRERYVSRRRERGFAYDPRPGTAAADLASCMAAWR